MTGVRLHFVVEGQTEETFVNRVLAPFLATHSVWASARTVITSRKKGSIFKGGLNSYKLARKDLDLWMREDHKSDAYFTTMFDLYQLPSDFPSYAEARKIRDRGDKVAYVQAIEKAFGDDVGSRRFIPYVQLHEFETLVLADPGKLDSEFCGHDRAIQNLVAMTDNFASPEIIDDGVDTAPSKRIIREIPEYEGMKASAGPIVVEKIGLPTLRAKCAHFDSWLCALEQLQRQG